jgi:GNAT superfamily N-acetyltransferase
MNPIGGDRMQARAFSFFAKHANPNIGARSADAKGEPARTWSVKGIEYRRLEQDYPWEELFEFNKLHGSTPHNFIPDAPVRAHLSQLATGATTVWGAFDGAGPKPALVGFLSAASSGGYWLETGPGEKATSFVNEFVVDASQRGKGIGRNLTKLSVDPTLGIFGINANIKEMYTTVHADNHASRAAFMQSGYAETLT